jgi:hypothetical protein
MLLLLFHFLKKLAAVWLVTIDLSLTVSKVFKFIIHDHLSYFFKHNLKPSQLGFCKLGSISTNSVTYVTTLSNCVGTQGQTDSVCFNSRNVTVLVKWFHSYFTNRHASVTSFGALPSSYPMKSGVPE